MKKLFIVFEGIDGSGTSTQSNLLKDYFVKHGQNAVLTAEPSNGPIGHLLREGLKKRVLFSKDEKRFDQQMAYLFAADRHDHLYNDVDGVYKLLGEGKHVICTRYYFSSLTYQADEGYEFVNDLNKRFPKPDLVIYIDNPIDASLERLQQRTVQDVYENKEKLLQVKERYNKIFADYDGKLLIVKGDQKPQEICAEIVKYVEDNF
ncbi:dTMP kinase [Cohnella sp. CIP 111063]|uniref:dTMP kinase n=1 Tax=unclassified Cohnella TaxID=2636738 RepID=UPI000B8C0420|nr:MULTISPECIES: dTMP kinase [unclassified Cohnella]OXS54771.1 dTMP kinase [Cohnella sp. CIP 111063]PRX64609.1 dTMP kinase [Cohnella sp. SGD-V74]